jgi:hypothetical protein
MSTIRRQFSEKFKGKVALRLSGGGEEFGGAGYGVQGSSDADYTLEKAYIVGGTPVIFR